MILVASPLRITLGGGGTDLPSYYEKRENGGFVLSAAINKYVYVSITKPFEDGIYLKYSKQENVKRVDEIKHPIIRESLNWMYDTEIEMPNLEITTLADIPSGTGLGSSSSFTVALLRALCAYERYDIDRKSLASLACTIEIEKLKEQIGKQDQYISALGGIRPMEFSKNIIYTPLLDIDNDILNRLNNNLLLFFTGYYHKSSEELKRQDDLSRQNDSEILSNLDKTRDIGISSANCLLKRDLTGFGNLINEQWNIKLQRSVMNERLYKIADWRDYGLKNGAIGGKLIGSGNGGFLLFYSEDQNRLRDAMSKINLREVYFDFDLDGVRKYNSY